jgi:hypothetical protein
VPVDFSGSTKPCVDIKVNLIFLYIIFYSVADPDPSDPYVLGPPGSGSASQRYGSGSGSFYHQAKILGKTLVPTVVL